MEKTTSKRIAGYFWGRMAEFALPNRIVALLFVVTSIAAMSFCQLGFWPIGVIDDKPVYLMLIFGPLIMGSLMFGPLTGLLLGLYAGAILYAHALAFPLDYYEVYFMTLQNTFLLMSAFGLVSGLLFKLVASRHPSGTRRACLIVAVCFVMSFAASGLMTANTIVTYGGLSNIDLIRAFLINSPLGLTVQALIDAVLMALLCLVADRILQRNAHRGANQTLLSMFGNWMLLVSSIVFMLSSGIIFSITTHAAQEDAYYSMQSEANYLKTQINAMETADYDVLLEGYSVPLKGYVVITDNEGKILATDDPQRYPAGESFVELLGLGDPSGEDEDRVTTAEVILGSIAEASEMTVLQAYGENAAVNMDFTFIAVAQFEGGYVGIVRSPDMVYGSRASTMMSTTSLAVSLIVAIAVLAALLLSRLVVRRVDETNKSLERITSGDLNERVNIRDSREFMSLSSGINTTVGALKDTIEEVKQRNAQDLATAKTIQESALPREFPPYPYIDKFDIYASMKTAKEVGGDFYDFFLIDDDKLGFVIADVSGKGIPAALFMMTAKTQIQTYMETGMSLGEAIDAANHQLCIGNDAGMFVTVWVGILEYETGLLTYVNAGHNPPLILHDGIWERVSDVSGMPLGLFDGMPYDAFTRQLEVEDVLYLYTDGVTEAMDAQGNLFGDDRLEDTLYTFAHMNARSIGVGVRRAITDYTKDAEQSDDITMLILKYGVEPETKAVMVLPAVDTQLVHVYNFIHEELHRRNAPKSVRNPLDIAAEELFVNVCHYAYPEATPDNPGEVRISFEYNASPPSLTVQIADDGIPYNPLAKPDAVTPDDIMDVPIGGLGILMAKRSVDAMYYERVGEANVLTFSKEW